MRVVRVLGALGMSAALCGCYLSDEPLLDPAAAVQPIPAGIYSSLDSLDTVRVTLLDDGGELVQRLKNDGGWEDGDRVLINRLGVFGGREVFAGEERDPQAGFGYGLLTIDAGTVSRSDPDCAQTGARQIAVSAGARFSKDDKGSICRFSTKASLRKALEAWARSGAAPSSEYRRQ